MRIRLLLGCLAIGALSAAPVARADTTDDIYLKVLHRQGITSSTHGDDGLIALAQQICADRASGFDEDAEIDRVSAANPKLDDYNAGFILGAAEMAYCPAYATPAPSTGWTGLSA